jgi:NADH-quinone oxidoreductase subunit M
MMLFWLILVPVAGGVMAWAAGRARPVWARWISLGALSFDLVLILNAWLGHVQGFSIGSFGRWAFELKWAWIPRFGVGFHLALDGLSLLLVALAVLLGFLSVLASWTEIRERVGFFHFNLLWVLAGIIGVFLALDLFLFYFFWELMLVPMYFLVGIWGHERRVFASIKFFIFTQAGGLLMLVSILAIYFLHGEYTGVYTFEYTELLGTPLQPAAGFLVMLGFLAAFLVKLPAVPFHTWLPDAHTQAPTAGSVVLAGLLLKTGAYGLLRFVLPLFPDAAARFRTVGMALGVIGILYGAHLAFGQSDLKRLVAYTSVSHMGYVLLGVFAMNALALQGTVLQIVCHAFSTGALFIIAGALQERLQTRDMSLMGGLWEKVPRLGGAAMFFALASLGLPGLGNFLAEFLILVGAYQRSVVISALAAVGLIVSTIYSLQIIQRVFHGKREREWRLADLNAREVFVLAVLALGLVWLGVYPQPVLRTVATTVEEITSRTAPAAANCRLLPRHSELPAADTFPTDCAGDAFPEIYLRYYPPSPGLSQRIARQLPHAFLSYADTFPDFYMNILIPPTSLANQGRTRIRTVSALKAGGINVSVAGKVGGRP